MKQEELAKSIDHTNLNPDATVKDIERLCVEAHKYNFASVCVNPCNVNIAHRLLHDSAVKVCTVAGFPLGATTSGAKAHEAREVIELGADEIDMVMNIGALKSGLYDEVYTDMRAVVEAARIGEVRAGRDIIIKVIIECGLLTDEQKIRASKIVQEAGGDFVKTSTGFAGSGATIEDVELIRSNVPFDMGIKASAGIKTADQAVALLNAGAGRIGTSSGVKIMEEALGERAFNSKGSNDLIR
ncbi:MAG: deoxyribose-phosphate aldolase [Actinobacteria bacterium]|nr:deoxyribose-phosphate aldolase [Actinomycetota bacterium]